MTDFFVYFVCFVVNWFCSPQKNAPMQADKNPPVYVDRGFAFMLYSYMLSALR